MPAVAPTARARVNRRWTRGLGGCVVALGLTAALATPAAAAPAAAPAQRTAFNSVSAGSAIVREAARHAGKSYRYGAAGPAHFDCSGFTMFVFSRFGVRLPHNSSAQSRVVRAIPAAQRRPGDLIFFHTRGGHITHVAIYAGGNSMWHSPHTGTSVRLAGIYSSRVTYGRVR